MSDAELDALLAAWPRIPSHGNEAVRAHFFELAGDREAAIRHFRSAAQRTASLAERHYLTTKAARLAQG